jgi:hypothetical protein
MYDFAQLKGIIYMNHTAMSMFFPFYKAKMHIYALFPKDIFPVHKNIYSSETISFEIVIKRGHFVMFLYYDVN